MTKILVVDDEKDVQTLFLQRFRKEIRKGELEFRFAFSGEEALSVLDTMEQEASHYNTIFPTMSIAEYNELREKEIARLIDGVARGESSYQLARS